MKVLIVTPHFYPENFKCNDMAFELNKRGHDVTVMTAIPDYPAGKYHAGYGIFKRRRECVNGVKIHRSFIIPVEECELIHFYLLLLRSNLSGLRNST